MYYYIKGIFVKKSENYIVVDVNGVIPSNEVTRFIVISFYVFDIVLAAIAVLLLPRVDVERHMPEITAKLDERKQEALKEQAL